MPLAPLRINPQSELDILTISEQPEERLEDAYSRLAAIKDNIISPTVLRSALEHSLAPGVVRALLQQLVGLRAYIDDAQVTPAEAVSALSLGLKDRKWPDGARQKWDRTAKIFERFLALDNVITTTKAFELAIDFEHILLDAKILTDIRLVYSVDRTKIIGGIICNRLRIKIHDEDSHKSFSISIDKSEIEHLKKICTEALTKIDLASAMLNSAKLPSFATGEGYDDFN